MKEKPSLYRIDMYGERTLARSLQGEGGKLFCSLGERRFMQGSSLILTSYQDSLRQAMDIVANNVANINTTGFKRENVAFDTYLMQPTTKDSFAFAVEGGTYRDAAQGPILTTGNPLDMAIQGQGYFSVQTTGGIRYTRAGAFQMNAEGELVTAAGDKVLGDGDQAIVLPPDAREILLASDGTLSAKTGAGSVAQVGRIRPVKFENEQNLQPVGNNLYSSAETPLPDDASRIVQGSIEQSNVQAITEMTRMIDVSRNYTLVVRMLEQENQRQSDAITRLGKVTA